MRTTVELPDDLLNRAKIAAVRRGITLKELIAMGIERELESVDRPPARKRVNFPVFVFQQAGERLITAEDIQRDELAEDLRLSASEQ